MSAFVPRRFPELGRLSPAYYLGHQAAGLRKMKEMLSLVDLVIECRDYRIPITSHNTKLDEALAGKEKVIVYTKQDLGSQGTAEDKQARSISALHRRSFPQAP